MSSGINKNVFYPKKNSKKNESVASDTSSEPRWGKRQFTSSKVIPPSEAPSSSKCLSLPSNMSPPQGSLATSSDSYLVDTFAKPKINTRFTNALHRKQALTSLCPGLPTLTASKPLSPHAKCQLWMNQDSGGTLPNAERRLVDYSPSSASSGLSINQPIKDSRSGQSSPLRRSRMGTTSNILRSEQRSNTVPRESIVLQRPRRSIDFDVDAKTHQVQEEKRKLVNNKENKQQGITQAPSRNSQDMPSCSDQVVTIDSVSSSERLQSSGPNNKSFITVAGQETPLPKQKKCSKQSEEILKPVRTRRSKAEVLSSEFKKPCQDQLSSGHYNRSSNSLEGQETPLAKQRQSTESSQEFLKPVGAFGFKAKVISSVSKKPCQDQHEPQVLCLGDRVVGRAISVDKQASSDKEVSLDVVSFEESQESSGHNNRSSNIMEGQEMISPVERESTNSLPNSVKHFNSCQSKHKLHSSPLNKTCQDKLLVDNKENKQQGITKAPSGNSQDMPSCSDQVVTIDSVSSSERLQSSGPNNKSFITVAGQETPLPKQKKCSKQSEEILKPVRTRRSKAEVLSSEFKKPCQDQLSSGHYNRSSNSLEGQETPLAKQRQSTERSQEFLKPVGAFGFKAKVISSVSKKPCQDQHEPQVLCPGDRVVGRASSVDKQASSDKEVSLDVVSFEESQESSGHNNRSSNIVEGQEMISPVETESTNSLPNSVKRFNLRQSKHKLHSSPLNKTYQDKLGSDVLSESEVVLPNSPNADLNADDDNSFGPENQQAFDDKLNSVIGDLDEMIGSIESSELSDMRPQRKSCGTKRSASSSLSKNCQRKLCFEFSSGSSKLAAPLSPSTSSTPKTTAYQLRKRKAVVTVEQSSSDMSDDGSAEDSNYSDGPDDDEDEWRLKDLQAEARMSSKSQKQRKVAPDISSDSEGDDSDDGDVFLTVPKRGKFLKKINPRNNEDQVVPEDIEEESSWVEDADLTEFTVPPASFSLPYETILEPVEYFNYFFDDEVISIITEHTNTYLTYMHGKGLLKSVPNVSEEEMRVFFGIWIYMGVVNLKCTRAYWAAETFVPQVANFMTYNRFSQIKSAIHVYDKTMEDDLDKSDRFRKVSNLFNLVRQKCNSIEQENLLSIDEAVIQYKGTCAGTLRQYIKNKPHKFGFKMFNLAGTSGMIYDFLPYQGSSTKYSLTEDESELLTYVGSKIVVHLAKAIDRPESCAVFFDNFFTSVSLVKHLKEKYQLHSIGTLRKDRLDGCSLMRDNQLRKAGRGAYDTKVKGNVQLIKWHDNKCVHVASSLAGIQPVSSVKRWDKKEKKKMDVPQPRALQLYNANMGGVDLHDMIVQLNRLPTRARRWYVPLIAYMVEISLVNSWLLYRRHAKLLGVEPPLGVKAPLASKEFRLSVSKSWKGAPKEGSVKKLKNPIVSPRGFRPAENVRYEGQHSPAFETKQARCKMCTAGKTKVTCPKCQVHLCFTPQRNCFSLFHMPT